MKKGSLLNFQVDPKFVQVGKKTFLWLDESFTRRLLLERINEVRFTFHVDIDPSRLSIRILAFAHLAFTIQRRPRQHNTLFFSTIPLPVSSLQSFYSVEVQVELIIWFLIPCIFFPLFRTLRQWPSFPF